MAKQAQIAESGRIYGGESAGERLARQRRRFLDAGLELFGTVGYHATTVRLLCRQAGLIDRYFYRNFKDTEDLLAAVFTESLGHIQAKVSQAITPLLSGSTDRVVEEGLDAFFKVFEDPRLARVCWLEVQGVGPRTDALYAQSFQRFADLLLAVGRQLLPEWPQSDEQARIIAIAVIGAISQSARYWLLSNYHAPRRTLVSANALVVRGVAGALSPGRLLS